MCDGIITRFQSLADTIVAKAQDGGLRYCTKTSYPSKAAFDSSTFEEATVEWMDTAEHGGADAIFRFDHGLLHLNHRSHTLLVRAYARDLEKAKALVELTKERVPRISIEEDVVEVAFWRNTQRNGAFSDTRKIDCPPWREIEENYMSPTRGALDRLLNGDYKKSLAGKLVLWHGEPGTGKTYALRSWARECRSLLDVHYIVDPDVFFANADYMFELLARASGEKLNLFVAEDTGELLAKDAKRASGQGLSRLLNVCDGLIGQGMRILFLITTNEELGALHPAVARPGRCYANIAFEPFSEKEAGKWLASRGVTDRPAPSRSTIAELYAMVDNQQIVTKKENVFGFVA